MADGARQAWTDERSAAGGRSPWLVAGVVSIATFMEVLDTSIANVSLNHIAGSLSASYDEATWVITSYLIANAIAVPISAWLSNIVGRKRFYLLSVAVFTIASFFCGLAPNLIFLILARIVQGLGGGGLAPSEQSILTQSFPPEKRGGAFALYGLVVTVAPILGPIAGGAITDSIGWHWIFLINVPVGLLSLWLSYRFVVDPPKLEQERQARLVETLDLGSANLQQWMQGAMSMGGSADQASAVIYGTVVRQAHVLAYSEVFWVLALIIGGVTPLLFFMKTLKPGEGAE